MPDRELRPAQRAVGAVEAHERCGRRVAGLLAVDLEEPAPDHGLPQALALEREEGELVGGVRDAQVAREGERVDHDRRIEEAHVLGAQVAVALDDAALAHAPVEERGVPLEEGEARVRERVHARGREAERGKRERVAVLAQARAQARAVRLRVAQRGLGAREEAREVARHRLHLRARERPRREQVIQHALVREPPHVHQPVHHLARAAEREPALRVDRERCDAQVHVGCEAPVEAHLLLAVVAAQRRRAEVEAVVADRLLELPRVRVGEEHPREVGLDRLHRPRPLRVRVGPAQEGDLRGQAGIARRGLHPPDAEAGAAGAKDAARASRSRTSSSSTCRKSR